MGIDRRFELDRRQNSDRRVNNSLNHFIGPEKRCTFDRRTHNDRRQLVLKPTKIDLFKNIS